MRSKNCSYKKSALHRVFTVVTMITTSFYGSMLATTPTATFRPLDKQELLKERATQSVVKNLPEKQQSDSVSAPKTFQPSVGATNLTSSQFCIDAPNPDNLLDFRFYSLRKRIREHLLTSFRTTIRHASQAAKEAYWSGRCANFHVEINADGTLACLILIQSSGCEELDYTFSQIFERAVPFPTIPESLNIKRYCISELLSED